MTGQPLLLDTHVWLWLMNGEETLRSSSACRSIEEASQAAGLRVSVISVWEVGVLESRGRISFPLSGEEWVRRALAAPGVSLAPLTPEIAFASSRLPRGFHGDPADRILVATARQSGAVLVTRDREILEYGAGGHVSVLPV